MPTQNYYKFKALRKNLQKKSNSALPLIATENMTSEFVQSCLSDDISRRYVLNENKEGDVSNWKYPLRNEITEIEQLGKNLTCKLYNAYDADLRALSGLNCFTSVLFSLTQSGDSIMRVPSYAGGHFSTVGVCERFGVHVHDIPFDSSAYTIDVDLTVKLAKKIKPKLIFLDQSMVLFPHPVKKLREKLPESIKISYDASQTLGLIGGGCFQDPINEGASLLHGSTHKTFFGPQKGLIAFGNDKEIIKNIKKNIQPFLASNAHLHHILSLVAALVELEEFGYKYAQQTILNAKTLAESMWNGDLNEKSKYYIFGHNHGYTRSHQVWVVIGSQIETEKIFEKLILSGINVTSNEIPTFSPGIDKLFGIRIGTQEITRMGFDQSDMKYLGQMISDIILSKITPEIANKKIFALMDKHKKLTFCY